THPTPWPTTSHPRRAAISSFGISGTNAHVIIEQPPPPAAAEPVEDTGPVPWLLSAHTPEGLRAQARRLSDHLAADPGLDLPSVARTLATGRAALTHRAAAVPSGPGELREALDAVADGRHHPAVTRGEVNGVPRTAYLFTGQGSQHPGMGRDLYRTYPVFAAALDEACAALDPHLDRPLRDILFSDPGTPDAASLHETRHTQPALFAMETALFRLLGHAGPPPRALLGHSVGSIAAAHVAGVLSLDDAATLVTARGRLMQALPAGGAMASLSLSEADAAALLDGEVSVAAVNGPRSTVVSGAEDAVLGVMERAAAGGAKVRRLTVSHAFHSSLMDPMLADFHAVVAGLTFAAPRIPIVSDHTGTFAGAEELASPGYWVRHVREPVRFADGVRALAGSGIDLYVEVGPDAVLSSMAAQTLPDARTVPVLRRDLPEPVAFTRALAALHVSGTPVDWGRLLPPAGRDVPVELPTYPFQRTRHWLDVPASTRPAAGLDTTGHPLLTAAVDLADADGTVFTGRISPRTHPWLAGHVIAGTTLLPATALLDLALTAGRHTGTPVVEELTLLAPMPIPEDAALQLQVTVAATDQDDRRTVSVHSREESGTWTLHASGVLTPAAGP
ncbi:type I polyketide synthase, partial [Sphaerisporangium rubeum]